jgi:hypothetical protein
MSESYFSSRPWGTTAAEIDRYIFNFAFLAQQARIYRGYAAHVSPETRPRLYPQLLRWKNLLISVRAACAVRVRIIASVQNS